MEEEIKFSIICPVYNADKFLVDCINSVLNQTYKNWELILVDDGSTDLSSSLCDEFSAKYAQIKVYHLKNCGPYNARIFGYKNASGNFILSMDSDDTYVYDALQTINKLIIENNFDLLFYNCFLEENGKKNVLDDFKYNNGLTSDHTQIVKTYFHNFILNQGLYRKCFSKALLNKIDLSNRSERIFEDGLFSLKLFNASKHLLVRNDLCLYSYRKINIESLTMKYSVDNIKIQFNNLLEHFVIVDNDVLLEHETKVDLYTILMKSILIFYKQKTQFLSKKEKRIFTERFLKTNAITQILKYKIHFKCLKKLLFTYIILICNNRKLKRHEKD